MRRGLWIWSESSRWFLRFLVEQLWRFAFGVLGVLWLEAPGRFLFGARCGGMCFVWGSCGFWAWRRFVAAARFFSGFTCHSVWGLGEEGLLGLGWAASMEVPWVLSCCPVARPSQRKTILRRGLGLFTGSWTEANLFRGGGGFRVESGMGC